jgi:cytochrome oxidase Cu insertion factor (SCO1/SenC/PrrC family)
MRALTMALCVGLLISSGAAQSRSAQAEEKESPARNYFTDVQLINQDGKPMRFYSDLLKDKVVIINTFFTTCTSVCPPMSRNLERVQSWLGDRLGKDVHIISISVDPVMDTPPRLKDYAQKYKARPGWFFVTGKKENAELALRKIGQFVESKDDHSTVMIIGNLRTGLWKKAMGMAKPEDLIKVIESVVDDKPEDVK